jgi:hypothetical protein
MKHLKYILLIFILTSCFIPNLLFGQKYHERVYNSPFDLKFQVIKDTNFVNLSSTIFNNKVDFRGTQFYGNDYFFLNKLIPIVNFSNSQFNNTVYFFGTEFKDYAFFFDTEFNDSAYFSDAKFDSMVIFDSTRFKGVVDFQGVKFNNSLFSQVQFDNSVDFRQSNFNRQTTFIEVQFKSNVDFSGSKFNEALIFHSTEFDTIANFSFVTFNNIANFSFSFFKDGALFYNTLLPDTLNFKWIRFYKRYDNIDLTLAHIKPNAKCYINLIGSDINKININYINFKLYFDETDSVFIKEKSELYTSLLDKFKKNKENQSFENLFIEYKDFKFNNGNWFRKMLSFIDYYLWNFGYSKWWIFLWIILFLLLIKVKRSIIKFINFVR